MRHLLLATVWAFSALSSTAQVQKSPVVVELYTSQGCSSCPPADEMLAELSQRDDVIALALHVDYWDYIGWADEFADPRHTRRQQEYARAAGDRTIYTPQFVIEGQDIVIGARAMQVAELVQSYQDIVRPVDVALSRTDAALKIALSLQDDSEAGPYIVQLAQVKKDQTVDIRRGENAGQTITYSNIVKTLDVIAEWDGATPLYLDADVPDDLSLAVIVQQGANGPVVGAAQLD